MYLSWDEKIIPDFTPAVIADYYDKGYVATRLGKGVFQQTRSIRVNLENFSETSENRRILKKGADIVLIKKTIPFSEYSWEIGKMAKDFYESRDADFSANKVKELLTDAEKTNFNTLLAYQDTVNAKDIGYTICLETDTLIHYSYPFYALDVSKDTGLVMMLQAITLAKNEGKKYIYLGSLQRSSDTYKLQFTGIEWFDGKEWQTNVETAKTLLKTL